MSLGSWIAQNKLAAGGIAAGAGFLYLSRRGGSMGSSSSQDATGQLVPVAAAYDTSTDTSSSEELSTAVDAANTAAQAATDAANNAGNGSEDIGVGQLATGLQQLQDTGLLPPFAATPAPSSVPQAQAAPTPQPSPAPAPNVPAPSPVPVVVASHPQDDEAAYRPGVNGWEAPNTIVKSKFGNAISWKDGHSGGTNSNGTYMTIIVNTPGHHNQYFHYYVSGKNKGDWVALN